MSCEWIVVSSRGSSGILFTAKTRSREEILCDSSRLRVFVVRFFWLRLGCTVVKQDVLPPQRHCLNRRFFED